MAEFDSAEPKKGQGWLGLENVNKLTGNHKFEVSPLSTTEAYHCFDFQFKQFGKWRSRDGFLVLWISGSILNGITGCIAVPFGGMQF